MTRRLAILLLAVILVQPSKAMDIHQMAEISILEFAASKAVGRGRFEEAETLFARVLAESQQPAIVSDRIAMDWRKRVGMFYGRRGNCTRAEEILKRNMEIAESSPALNSGKVEPGETLNHYYDLASVQESCRHLDDAEQVLTRALIKADAIPRADRAGGEFRMAELCARRGQPEEANKWLAQVLVTEANKSPAWRRKGALAAAIYRFKSLAEIYDVDAHPEAAEAVYKQRISFYEQAFAPEGQGFRGLLDDLAGFYQARGRFEEAEPILQRALEVIKKSWGPDDPMVASSFGRLASLYREQRRFTEAETLLKHMLMIYEKQRSDESAYGDAMFDLASLYSMQSRLSEAEPLYKRAVEIKRKDRLSLGERLAAFLKTLAETYQALGRDAEAEACFEEVERLLRKALEADVTQNQPTALILLALAKFYDQRGLLREAEPLARQAVAISEFKYGAGHPEMASPLYVLAEILRREQRYADAALLYNRAITILEKRLGAGHRRVEEIRNALTSVTRAPQSAP